MIENGKIKNKLIYYTTQEAYEEAVEKDMIHDSSIVFVEESGKIYTHGHEFGGSSGTNTEYNYEITKQYTDDQVTQAVGRVMDSVEGLIKDFATRTYVTNALTAYGNGLNVSDRVEQILNAKDPSWEVIVNRLISLEEDDQYLNEQIANIKASIENDGNGGSYPTITLETIYRLFNEGDSETFKDIVAKIFMMANADGSSITLDADKIYFGNENNQLKLYIRGAIQDSLRVENSANALTHAQLLATGLKFEDANGNKIYLTQNDGLKHTAGTDTDHTGENGYWLKNDGSGELAFGKISWNSDGELTTNGLMLAEAEAMGAANAFIVDSVHLLPTFERQGVSDFQSTGYFTIINYRICKAGFIIKQGQVSLDSQFFMQSDANPKNYVSVWTSSNYGVASNATLYTVEYRAYRVQAITAQGILASISKTIRDESWANLIKNSNGEYIFKNEDNVYVNFPGQVYVVKASSGSIFVGLVDGNPSSETFANASQTLKNNILRDLDEDGTWYSPTYTFCGEYDSAKTYNKYDVVRLFAEDGEYFDTYYRYKNFLCVKDNVSSKPNPNATSDDNVDWVDCKDIAQVNNVLDNAGESSGEAANKWVGGTEVSTSHKKASSSDEYITLYHVGGTYQYYITPTLTTTVETRPILFYGSHIISWNNDGFSYQ